jgi:thiamine kinase-like enzyme
MMPWLLTVQEVYLTEMTESDKVSIARLGRWLLSNSCILNYLAKAWNESHIIHGDLHWQNLLVANADSETPELRMIDWEFAALGDPFWDVATLLSDYLIQSVTANGQITPDRLPILMSILIKASMGQTDYASLRRIIQLTGLATLQQYTQWIINKLPFSVKSNELYEQATRYLTNPDSVLEAWSTL